MTIRSRFGLVAHRFNVSSRGLDVFARVLVVFDPRLDVAEPLFDVDHRSVAYGRLAVVPVPPVFFATYDVLEKNRPRLRQDPRLATST